ncbi:hypothetical protein VULLAG_LOCUS21795 [Vulpes lagopus]
MGHGAVTHGAVTHGRDIIRMMTAPRASEERSDVQVFDSHPAAEDCKASTLSIDKCSSVKTSIK